MSTEQHGTNVPAVVQQYQIMQAEPATIGDIIQSNIGAGGLGEFDLDRIHVPSGGATKWTVETLSGEATEEAIEGIIIYKKTTRSYWETSFDEGGGGNPPDCSSKDGVTGYGNPGGDCESCPLNQWGSGKNGEGKACRETMPIFLVGPHGMLPTVIVVPPSSLKPIKKYMARLASAAKKYNSVITRFTLKRERSKGNISYGEVIPAMVAALEPEQHERMEAYTAQFMPAIERVRFDTREDAKDPAEADKRQTPTSQAKRGAKSKSEPSSTEPEPTYVGEAV